MSIWDFQQALSRRLLAWNLLNMGAGIWFSRKDEFWRGFGSQNIGWSLINIAIAFFGARSSARCARLPDANSQETLARESRNLRRILWINSALDIIFMIGGWRMAQRTASQPLLRGMGIGIVLQGALLFLFDVLHAPMVPRTSNQNPASLTQKD